MFVGISTRRKTVLRWAAPLLFVALWLAYVLGALPFIVMSMVYLTTPDYILILFRTKVGNFLLVCAAAWMTIGLLVMKKMINFKY